MSHQKMDQLVGFLLHPPPCEIAKKLGKMLKYTLTFKVLSTPLDAPQIMQQLAKCFRCNKILRKILSKMLGKNFKAIHFLSNISL